MPGHLILSKEIAYRKIQRMAYEIAEQNISEKQVILAGIRNSGVIIARILHGYLKQVYKGKIVIIEIAIDKKNPKSLSLSKEINFDGQNIIVIDDVANSGRTLLYAIKPFLGFYPKKIQTLVLVERSYKEFPVSPDYVGFSISTALDERIIVETDGDEIIGARLE